MTCTVISLHRHLCRRVANLAKRAFNQEPGVNESYHSSEGAMDRLTSKAPGVM